ncbi:MAG: diacylglycerol kinase [Pseudolabrys sp.]|jgi:diacylglycerol kinase (ATP)
MRIYNATLNTLRGLACAAKSETAPRQEMVALGLALPAGALIAPGIGWYVAMIASLLATLAIELLNTAIEKLADRVTMERDVKIGMAKDYGSAAVFCALCIAALIWIAAIAVRFNLL